MVEQTQTVVAAPLVDAHIHPDKSSWGGPWLSRTRADTLRDFIDNDVRTQAAYTRSVEARALALLRTAAGLGTRAMRAHVDVGPATGIANVRGVRAAADQLKDLLDVEIVAFPQQGLLTAPGTLDLLNAALTEGADVVGGIDPEGLEGDFDGHLDAIFGLAAVAEGIGERLTISHAFAVGAATGDALRSIADDIASAGTWLVTCALGGDPVLPVRFLRERGVNVAVGSDGVRDSWTPFGNGSMLDRAHLLAYRTDAMTDADLELAYDLCSRAGAALLGLDVDGDSIEYAGECLAQVVIDRPKPLRVLRDGDVIARDGVLVS